MLKQNKGVTLIALTITIILLLIIASIATSSGTSVLKYANVSNAKAQLEIMQVQVNSWYEKYKSGDDDVLEYGDSNISNYYDIFSNVGVTDTSDYRLFTSKYINEDLDIDGIEYDMLINIKNRKIILTNGVKDDEKTYYTLEDYGILNVENE